ncbi:MAG TPA: NAD(P)H-dependent glycerol-3-phosphate dehydrogenase [Gaiellales bacterium]
MRALVIGGGSWGTAFACVLARRGHVVTLGVRDPDAARAMARDRTNAHYLPQVPLEALVTPAALDLPRQCSGADLVVLAVPSRAFASVAADVRLDDGALALSLTKGLEPSSGQLLLDVLAERASIDPAHTAFLTGPNHAEEIGQGHPAAAVLTSPSPETAVRLQSQLTGGLFRIYRSDDVVGVQLCAAAKNVIAVAAGASDGLGFGDNAKAALMTRGLAEMARLGAAFGADPRTYAGLAGMGDLVATCTSRHSRNRAAGEQIAQGVTPGEIEGRLGQAVEGLTTAPALRSLGVERGVDLPITESVCAVVEGMPLAEALLGLLERVPASEHDASRSADPADLRVE